MANPSYQSRIFLNQALDRVGKILAKSPLTYAVTDILFNAFCDGDLLATGDLTDNDGGIIKKNQEIAPSKWQSISNIDFRSRCYDLGVLKVQDHRVTTGITYTYINVYVTSVSFEEWIKKLSKKENFQTKKTKSSPLEDHPTYKTGVAGKPTSKDFLLQELNERAKSKKLESSLSKEVDYLLRWLVSKHPNAVKPKKKSAENAIRTEYNLLKSTTKKNP